MEKALHYTFSSPHTRPPDINNHWVFSNNRNKAPPTGINTHNHCLVINQVSGYLVKEGHHSDPASQLLSRYREQLIPTAVQ